MKKEFIINFHRQWDDDGTCYSQTINITKETLDKLHDCLDAELAMPKYHKNVIDGDDYSKQLYLKNSFRITENNFAFINLTQRDFFNKFLKLKLLDRNTCFKIID
jgi:hypothetical protein